MIIVSRDVLFNFDNISSVRLKGSDLWIDCAGDSAGYHEPPIKYKSTESARAAFDEVITCATKGDSVANISKGRVCPASR